jgi:hypothetical protein
MGRAGRRRVLKHFTWSRVAADMFSRYEQLCGREASQRPIRPVAINERIDS